MKFSITSKFKIFVIITLSLLVVGIALFSIFGFNKSVDYKECSEVIVSVDQNENGVAGVVKDITLNYLDAKGYKTCVSTSQEIDDGAGYIFKFNETVKLDEADLSNSINSELAKNPDYSSVKSTVVFSETYSQEKYNNYTGVIVGIAISAVISFICVFFAEKFANALTVFIVSIGATLTYLALLGITRIPVKPYVFVFILFTLILSEVISIVLLNRCSETVKIVSEEKLSNSQIADKSFICSLPRIIFLSTLLLAFSIAFMVCGIFASNLLFVGLQILVSTVSAVYTSICFAPAIWTKIKG